MASHQVVQPGQESTESNAAPDSTLNQEAGGGEGSSVAEITAGTKSEPQLSGEEKQLKREAELKQRAEEQQRKKDVEEKLRKNEQHVLDVIEVYQEKEYLLAKEYYAEEERENARTVKQLHKRGFGQTQPPATKTPPKDLSFKEIKNLVFIESSEIHKKALEDWTKKEKLFASRVERKNTRVGNLKNEVYQLIGFFSVFQGVVLTAVSQANLLHCNNRWSPIVLSVLASIVTIAAIAQKLWQISSFQKTIYSEEAALKAVVRRSQELRREGPNFKFAKFAEDDKIIAPKKDFFWLYSGIVLIFLIVFTVAFPVSYWRILCYPGSCGSSPPSA